MKLFVKSKDKVKVLSGKCKGSVGVVKSVYPKTQMAIVEGVCTVIKHKKKSENKSGEKISKEVPIRICKLVVVDPVLNVPTRIGRRRDADGKLKRYSKKSGNFVDK